MELTDGQIQAAVNWWADKVARPKMDNGDDSPAGGIGMMLGMLLVKPVASEQQEVFKAALSKKLKENGTPWLSVDYGPDRLLGEAMEEAGISLHNAPWKTSMSFYDGKVTVSYGYGAPSVQIYPLPEASKEPPCAAQ